jgi:hypothetical protein
MKKSYALIAALAALTLAASPALAAGKSKPSTKYTADTCASMAKQLEDAIGTHAGSPKLDQAKKLKTDGDQACAASKYRDGVRKYQAGLKDLNVKPVHK